MNPTQGAPVPVWTVHRNNDDRSNGPITEICATKSLANQVAAGSGWYGGNASIEEHHAIIVDGVAYILADDEPITIAYTLDDIVLAEREAIKKQALMKLSEREREVLGL